MPVIDFGEILPVTDGLAEILAPTALEHADLFAASVSFHGRGHAGIRQRRLAHLYAAVAGHEQHAVEVDGITHLHVEFLDTNDVAGRYPVLFAAAFNDRVHT